jgi:hypothetical protein
MSDLSALGAEVGRLAHQAKMDAIMSPRRVPNVAAQRAAIASWQAQRGAPSVAPSSGIGATHFQAVLFLPRRPRRSRS